MRLPPLLNCRVDPDTTVYRPVSVPSPWTTNVPAFTFHQVFVDRMLAAGVDRDAFDAAVAEGRGLTVQDAVAEAQGHT